MTPEHRLYTSRQLIRIAQLTELAMLITKMLYKEKFIIETNYKALKGAHDNLKCARTKVYSRLTPSSQQLADSQVLDAHTVTTMCDLIDIVIAVDPKHRQRIVNRLEKVYEEYEREKEREEQKAASL